MGVESKIEKRIEEKRQEVANLKLQLAQAEAHLNGLMEGFKLFQRTPQNGQNDEVVLREGGDVAKAKNFLEKHKTAFHINDILKGIGKPTDRTNRVSLSSQLGTYARKGIIFSRVGPNKYGLIGKIEQENDDLPSAPIDDLPF